MTLQSITLAGGCFWCLEAVFELVEGVVAVESGYANGHLPNPRYEQVCEGTTGHAEVCRVRFDADRISLAQILEIFFAVHDPTTPDRQGHDVGPQYRSAIYWHEAAQEPVVRQAVAQANVAHAGRIVTELAPLVSYWPAEAYHQHYFASHPGQGYCAFVIAPKLAEFRRAFAARLRPPGQVGVSGS